MIANCFFIFFAILALARNIVELKVRKAVYT